MVSRVSLITICLAGFTFVACADTRCYTDLCAPLRTDTILSITIEIHTEELKTISITDDEKMKEFISAVNDAKVDGQWKGAKWDKIILNYKDEVRTYNTNGEVFGRGSSGLFYKLDKKYKHYWK